MKVFTKDGLFVLGVFLMQIVFHSGDYFENGNKRKNFTFFSWHIFQVIQKLSNFNFFYCHEFELSFNTRVANNIIYIYIYIHSIRFNHLSYDFALVTLQNWKQKQQCVLGEWSL